MTRIRRMRTKEANRISARYLNSKVNNTVQRESLRIRDTHTHIQRKEVNMSTLCERGGARDRLRAGKCACYVCTYYVGTIGPRKGGIAGSRGRHRGGEPLCCLRATKTMRRHQAARDAPRQLCRLSSHTLLPCTHHVRAPSSGDGGEARRHGKKNKPRGTSATEQGLAGLALTYFPHARKQARTHVTHDNCTLQKISFFLSRPAGTRACSSRNVRWRAYRETYSGSVRRRFNMAVPRLTRRLESCVKASDCNDGGGGGDGCSLLPTRHKREGTAMQQRQWQRLRTVLAAP